LKNFIGSVGDTSEKGNFFAKLKSDIKPEAGKFQSAPPRPRPEFQGSSERRTWSPRSAGGPSSDGEGGGQGGLQVRQNLYKTGPEAEFKERGFNPRVAPKKRFMAPSDDGDNVPASAGGSYLGGGKGKRGRRGDDDDDDDDEGGRKDKDDDEEEISEGELAPFLEDKFADAVSPCCIAFACVLSRTESVLRRLNLLYDPYVEIY
jgi:hypothetical protein